MRLYLGLHACKAHNLVTELSPLPLSLVFCSARDQIEGFLHTRNYCSHRATLQPACGGVVLLYMVFSCPARQKQLVGACCAFRTVATGVGFRAGGGPEELGRAVETKSMVILAAIWLPHGFCHHIRKLIHFQFYF